MTLTLQQLPMAEKLVHLAADITTQKGECALFGLFLREAAPSVWDLVVSAPWLEPDRKGGMEDLAGLLQSRLTSEELLSLSRIVVLDTDDPGVWAMQRWRAVRGELTHLQNVVLFGLRMREAYVVISQDPEKSREALEVLAGEWAVEFPGGKEHARIDPEGNYYVEDPRYGYSLGGDPKYVLQSLRYDPRTSTITFTKIKRDGSEPKPETLTVVSQGELKGHANDSPEHKLHYKRSR